MKVRFLPLLLLHTACASSPAVLPAATSTQLPAQMEAPVAVQISTATPTTVAASVTEFIPEPTATQPPPLASANDKCNNPYFPIVDGATWNYELSSGGKAAHTLTVGEDLTFTILVTGAETTFRIEGQCLEEASC